MSIALEAKIHALEKRVAELERASNTDGRAPDQRLFSRIEEIERWMNAQASAATAKTQGRRNG